MKRNLMLKGWSAMMGAMDALTGLGLMFAPGLVLGCLRIASPPQEALVFLRWIGAFVCAVGLSYALALGSRKQRGEAVWISTAMARLIVAVFIAVELASGGLAPAWAVVAIADALVAIVQLVVVWRGWWKEDCA